MSKRWYVLGINPEPWAIGPLSVIKVNNRYIPKVGRNPNLAAYQAAVQDEIHMQDPELMTGQCKVRFYYWRNMAEYVTPQARSHRKHEADTTNLNKGLEDALQKILYLNDKDNQDVSGIIVAQGPDVVPCIAISIEPFQGLDPDEIPPDVWAAIEKQTPLPFGEAEVRNLFEPRGEGDIF